MSYRTEVFFMQKKFMRALTAGEVSMELMTRLNMLDMQGYSLVSMAPFPVEAGSICYLLVLCRDHEPLPIPDELKPKKRKRLRDFFLEETEQEEGKTASEEAPLFEERQGLDKAHNEEASLNEGEAPAQGEEKPVKRSRFLDYIYEGKEE